MYEYLKCIITTVTKANLVTMQIQHYNLTFNFYVHCMLPLNCEYAHLHISTNHSVL